MSKFKSVGFVCLFLARLSFADEVIIDLKGRLEFDILDNGQLNWQHDDVFLNDEKVDLSEVVNIFKPPTTVTTVSTTTHKTTSTTHKHPDPSSTKPPDRTPSLPSSTAEIPTQTPGVTEDQDETTISPESSPQTGATPSITTSTTSIELPEYRETADSESMVVFVIIGSIVATVAVSGAIVGLLAHFKATPLLAAAIAAE